jgi:hypothetical protein
MSSNRNDGLSVGSTTRQGSVQSCPKNGRMLESGRSPLPGNFQPTGAGAILGRKELAEGEELGSNLLPVGALAIRSPMKAKLPTIRL